MYFGQLDTSRLELDVLECKWLWKILFGFSKMLIALRHWLNFHWLWRFEPIVVRRYGVHFWKYFSKFNKFWNGKLHVALSSTSVSLLINLSYVFFFVCVLMISIYLRNTNTCSDLYCLVFFLQFWAYTDYLEDKLRK